MNLPRVWRSVCSALLLSFLLLAIPLASAEAETSDDAGGKLPASSLSDACREALGAAGSAAICDVTIDAGANEKVVVVLSESLTAGKESNCSQIVSCIRSERCDRSGKTVSEDIVMAVLRQNFSHCLIEGEDGLKLLSNYASLVYQWIAGIVGAICIVVVIFSGIQISIGGLSQDQVSTAKDRVGNALFGLVILFLSALILYTINPIFFK
ncbi:MAG: pilin [bacterium]|nr:pilin [bacterium]